MCVCVGVCVRRACVGVDEARAQEKLALLAERTCELDALPKTAKDIGLAEGSAAVEPWQVVADAQQVSGRRAASRARATAVRQPPWPDRRVPLSVPLRRTCTALWGSRAAGVAGQVLVALRDDCEMPQQLRTLCAIVHGEMVSKFTNLTDADADQTVGWMLFTRFICAALCEVCTRSSSLHCRTHTRRIVMGWAPPLLCSRVSMSFSRPSQAYVPRSTSSGSAPR